MEKTAKLKEAMNAAIEAVSMATGTIQSHFFDVEVCEL
jgi:hypothetical protein